MCPGRSARRSVGQALSTRPIRRGTPRRDLHLPRADDQDERRRDVQDRQQPGHRDRRRDLHRRSRRVPADGGAGSGTGGAARRSPRYGPVAQFEPDETCPPTPVSSRVTWMRSVTIAAHLWRLRVHGHVARRCEGGSARWVSASPWASDRATSASPRSTPGCAPGARPGRPRRGARPGHDHQFKGADGTRFGSLQISDGSVGMAGGPQEHGERLEVRLEKGEP